MNYCPNCGQRNAPGLTHTCTPPNNKVAGADMIGFRLVPDHSQVVREIVDQLARTTLKLEQALVLLGRASGSMANFDLNRSLQVEITDFLQGK